MTTENQLFVLDERHTAIIVEQGGGVRDFNRLESGFCKKVLTKTIVLVLLLTITSFFYWIMRKSGETRCITSECNTYAYNLHQDMNFAADPCYDFQAFTCGNWLSNHPRPDIEKLWAWDNIAKENVTSQILKLASSKPATNEPKIVNQIRKFFDSCKGHTFEQTKKTFSEYLEKFQLPILPMIFKNSKSNDNFDWIKSIADIKRTIGINVIVSLDIITNSKNRSQQVIKLGIPDNFLVPFNSSNERDNEVLESIFNFKLKLLNPGLNGNFSEQFKKILKIDDLLKRQEPNMYKVDWTNLNELDEKLRPQNAVWRHYLETIFTNIPINVSQHIISANSEYLRFVFEHLSNIPKEEMELYIWWNVVDDLVDRIYVDSDENTNRPLECASQVQDYIAMIATYSVFKLDFEHQVKPKIAEMVMNIRSAFHAMVKSAQWLDDTTKDLIIDKSEAMKIDIGLPEWLLNENKMQEYYGALNFNETNFMEDLISALQNDMIIKLKSLISKKYVWVVNPGTANNNRATNTITIPIALLQYPFYGTGLKSLSYGSIGSIIAHELVHGFDDGGKQYDKNGNFLGNYWNNKTLKEYEKRNKCFVKQYNNSYIPEINSCVDGKRTLDENISDNVGLRVAFNAYKVDVEKHGEDKILPLFENFTHDQLFFISFGYRWCHSNTKEYLESIVKNSSHSPPNIRVNNVVANLNEFKVAFGCSKNSNMVSKNPCGFW